MNIVCLSKMPKFTEMDLGGWFVISKEKKKKKK